ncbi:MAG: MFS transporter [Candidatus Binatia bacterium]|nr:MFS transporter [Candidatus Binatia bacterium]
MVKSHAEESLGSNPGEAALNPADSVAMGVPSSRAPHTVEPIQSGIFAALRHRDYQLLFAAFVVNQTGFWLAHISLQALMVDLSHGDPFQVGLLTFALLIPALVLAPIAGALADRIDRKTIVLTCYAMVVVVSGILGWLSSYELITPAVLLGLAFWMGSTFAFAGPATMAIAANAVHREDLASAVALQSAMNNLTRVVGPLLAAPLVASGRYAVGFLVFAGASAVAGVLVSRMRVSNEIDEDETSGILERIRDGWDHARERRPALAAIATAGCLSVFGIGHIAMLPVFAARVLGDEGLFPWLVATTAFGAMLGALVTGRDPRPTLAKAAVRLALYGLAFAVFASSTVPWMAFGAQFVVGYFYFAVMTGLQTLIQQLVDDDNRGRVMSLFQVAWGGLTPIGSLAMGAVAGLIGIGATLQFAALGCVVSGVAMRLYARR